MGAIEWRENSAGYLSGVGAVTDLVFEIKTAKPQVIDDADYHYLGVMKAGSLPYCVGAYRELDAAKVAAEQIDAGQHDRVRFDPNAPSGVVVSAEYASRQDAQMAYGGRLYF